MSNEQTEAVTGTVVTDDGAVDETTGEVTAVAVPPAKDVVQVAHSMDLTFSREQTELTPKQATALSGVLNFDPRESAKASAAVQAFLHLSISRGLDPFAREVYLLARGKGDKRGYTMQIGIDGYRKIAASTGNYIGIDEVVWTGRDDDKNSWHWDERNAVMRRVWFDQWPASRGVPGAARVTVLHYDSRGAVVRTSAVADWEMYAPYNDVWEGPSGSRRKKVGPDGKPVRELSEMWENGGPHMLAKCGEALALRKAIPGALSGMYIHEEMHRADQIEKVAQGDAAKRRIIEAHAAGAVKPVPDAEPVPDPRKPEPEAVADEPGAAPAGPLLDLGAAPEPEAEDGPEPDPAEALGWLRAEVAFQAAVLDRSIADIVKRQMQAAGVEAPSDLGVDDLGDVVFSTRGRVVSALRKANRDPEADAYARWDKGQIGPLDVLLGTD